MAGVKNVRNKIDMELEAQDAEFERVYECPEGCGRTFKRVAIEKHVKICKKVFQLKYEEGDMQMTRPLQHWSSKTSEVDQSSHKRRQSQNLKSSRNRTKNKSGSRTARISKSS